MNQHQQGGQPTSGLIRQSDAYLYLFKFIKNKTLFTPLQLEFPLSLSLQLRQL
jgi:hypothetical protein